MIWRTSLTRDVETRRRSHDLLLFILLSRDEREKTHVAGAFDSLGELPLAFSRDTSSFARLKTAMRIEKLFQKFDILIVDILDVILGEITLFSYFCDRLVSIHVRDS